MRKKDENWYQGENTLALEFVVPYSVSLCSILVPARNISGMDSSRAGKHKQYALFEQYLEVVVENSLSLLYSTENVRM